MLVLDLYVFTLKFLAYKKRLKHEKKILSHFFTLFPSITDGVHRIESFVEIISVFSTFCGKKNEKLHRKKLKK